MIDTPAHVTIEDLTFEVRHSERRKTVGVTVDRDGSLILHVPCGLSLDRAITVARDRQLWVHTKLAEKRLRATISPPKEYVTGEGFYYLGRSHRLRLIDSDNTPRPLRLYQGRFELSRSERARAHDHFLRWYREHARRWIGGRVERLAPRIGASPTDIRVASIGNRWGSCSSEGRLNFHWRTILLPVPIAEYIVAHELVHLLEHQHSPAFWQRLERAMPDYDTRRQWLADHGSRFNL